jgi:hypothetical protein
MRMISSVSLVFVALLLLPALAMAEPKEQPPGADQLALEMAIFGPELLVQSTEAVASAPMCDSGPVGCGLKGCLCIEECGAPDLVAYFRCNPYTCQCF